jgi:2-hydroxychromene-2-carboxylate isomerase
MRRARPSVPATRSFPTAQSAGGAGRACRDQEWGDDFCRAVFHAEFAEGRAIDDAEVMADLLMGLQVEPGPTLEAAQSDAIKAKLRSETDEAERLGIFGAPTFVTGDGELFWGNDRLEQALRWAKRA